MALTVDTDTYITRDDAFEYISDNYPSTDPKRTAWENITQEDQDTYLRRAAKVLDRQPYVGFKAVSTQTMEFPRAIYTDARQYGELVDDFIHRDGWYIQQTVPDNVKFAQVEIALDLANGISKRVELQRQGVKGFSIGKLSESFTEGKPNALPYEARELLKEYTAGGARIC